MHNSINQSINFFTENRQTAHDSVIKGKMSTMQHTIHEVAFIKKSSW